MESWEFLIQKEGDRTWHILESPNMQLTEDRYRLVVRTTRTDTEVDIRIVHISTDEDPPKRRMQKRFRSTNSQGLMVLIPFTHLKPGIWELRCRPDLLDDLIGDSWEYTLRLQILPKPVISNITEQAQDQPSAVISLAELGESEETQQTQQTQENIPPLIAQASSDSSTPIPTSPSPETNEPVKTNPWAGVFANKPGKTSAYPLLITLKQETYIARQGLPFNLSGQIKLPATLEDLAAANSPPVIGGKLVIRLQDPQNGQILAQRQEILPDQEIPFTFSCDIEIPPNSNTRLMLGEVTFYSATETPADSPIILANKSFTITADLNDLLSAIADNFTDTERLDLPLGKSQKAALDLSALEQIENTKTIEFQPFQPSPGAILPPLLYEPDPVKKAAKPLDLPTFRNPASVPPSPPIVEDDPASSNLETTETEQLSPEEASTSISEIEPNLEINAETDPNSEAETDVNQEEPSLSSEDIAFESLRLQDRFWSRLNAIATDVELTAELGIEDELDDANPSSKTLNSLSPGGLDDDLAALEIVVDDEQPELPPTPHSPLPTLPPFDEEPIPTPQLEIPTGELIAGERIRIRIKVPMRQPRLGVKLWVVDIQTRSIVESPRWIGDFVPDPWGNLEATTYIAIPFGSLEVRFEAIATEISTKRESHKASVLRTIVPPNLPSFSPDEL